MTHYNARYKTGDTVRLLSGGPPMTVQHEESHYASTLPHPVKDPIPCIWFDQEGHCHQRVFAADVVGP